MDAGAQDEAGAGEVTRLLGRVAAGDETAWNLVYEIVLGDLRRVAVAMLRRERAGHTLQKPSSRSRDSGRAWARDIPTR